MYKKLFTFYFHQHFSRANSFIDKRFKLFFYHLSDNWVYNINITAFLSSISENKNVFFFCFKVILKYHCPVIYNIDCISIRYTYDFIYCIKNIAYIISYVYMVLYINLCIYRNICTPERNKLFFNIIKKK